MTAPVRQARETLLLLAHAIAHGECDRAVAYRHVEITSPLPDQAARALACQVLDATQDAERLCDDWWQGDGEQEAVEQAIADRDAVLDKLFPATEAGR